MKTTAPGGSSLIALYDGDCRICTREARRLARLARPGSVETRSFQEDGVLDAFPGITHDAAMKRIHVVTPAGAVYAGAEAIARVAMRVPIVGWMAWVYYVPGVRQLAEIAYRLVAKYRYRFGKSECERGTCKLHG
jgi:predicted DCC family thiol-disulfide oxidoreductase YuxK